MDIAAWFDINNTLVNIPIGSGYAMSWIEAVGTVFGLLCIWFASQEKTINYLFGLVNVTLFAIIFFIKYSSMASCCYSCFSSAPISMAGMPGPGRISKPATPSRCVGCRSRNWPLPRRFQYWASA